MRAQPTGGAVCGRARGISGPNACSTSGMSVVHGTRTSLAPCPQAAPCTNSIIVNFQQPTRYCGASLTHWRLPRAAPLVAAAIHNGNSHVIPPADDPLPGFDRIDDALAEVAAGRFVVVLDDEKRENEGDLIIAADKVTAQDMAFMVEHTSGVVCIGMEGADLDRLKLPLMVSSTENEEAMTTAFTITVDLREGTSTGISAQDRAKTIRHLANPNSVSEDFRRPGHIFPLRYRPGGVLVRPGHTEASVDLARLSGCYPAGVLCEIVDKRDGSMARTPQLLEFARQHGLKCITIADLVRYMQRHGHHAAANGHSTTPHLLQPDAMLHIVNGAHKEEREAALAC